MGSTPIVSTRAKTQELSGFFVLGIPPEFNIRFLSILYRRTTPIDFSTLPLFTPKTGVVGDACWARTHFSTKGQEGTDFHGRIKPLVVIHGNLWKLAPIPVPKVYYFL